MKIELPPGLAEIAKEQLGETEEIREECIQKLRNMLQCHTKEFEEIYKAPDDKFLLRFLRVSKFKVDKAYNRVNSYYQVRKKYKADLWDKANILELLPIFDLKIFQVMPKKTKDHEIVIYWNMKPIDYRILTVEHLFQCTILFELVIQNFEEIQIAGAKVIMNLRGMDKRHIFHVTPSLMYKTFTCHLNLLPARLHSAHSLNMPSLARVPLNFGLGLLTSKLRSRIVFHGSDLKSLHKHIDPSVLPEELGGTGPEMDVEEWVKLIVTNFPNEIKNSLEKSDFDPKANYPDPHKNFPHHWTQKYYHLLKTD